MSGEIGRWENVLRHVVQEQEKILEILRSIVPTEVKIALDNQISRKSAMYKSAQVIKTYLISIFMIKAMCL